MKRIMVLGAVVILVSIALSGCDTQNNTGSNTKSIEKSYSDYVRVSNVKVVTKWHYKIEKPGFYHDYPEDKNPDYVITGSIKNIADKPIDYVRLTATFKDSSGNVITTKTAGVSSLYMDETKSFTITVASYLTDYFEYISDYQLEITRVDFH